jgi:hypothetical protein
MTIEERLEAATAAVLARFFGGSSGLDDMAEAIARDHAEAALRAGFPEHFEAAK